MTTYKTILFKGQPQVECYTEERPEYSSKIHSTIEKYNFHLLAWQFSAIEIPFKSQQDFEKTKALGREDVTGFVAIEEVSSDVSLLEVEPKKGDRYCRHHLDGIRDMAKHTYKSHNTHWVKGVMDGTVWISEDSRENVFYTKLVAIFREPVKEEWEENKIRQLYKIEDLIPSGSICSCSAPELIVTVFPLPDICNYCRKAILIKNQPK